VAGCETTKGIREQKNIHRGLNMDHAFLRFLDQTDEEQKLLRSQKACMIEHQGAAVH
jgi:hypothetical protein